MVVMRVETLVVARAASMANDLAAVKGLTTAASMELRMGDKGVVESVVTRVVLKVVKMVVSKVVSTAVPMDLMGTKTAAQKVAS